MTPPPDFLMTGNVFSPPKIDLALFLQKPHSELTR
jgi:hypothetical protein